MADAGADAYRLPIQRLADEARPALGANPSEIHFQVGLFFQSLNVFTGCLGKLLFP